MRRFPIGIWNHLIVLYTTDHHVMSYTSIKFDTKKILDSQLQLRLGRVLWKRVLGKLDRAGKCRKKAKTSWNRSIFRNIPRKKTVENKLEPKNFHNHPCIISNKVSCCFRTRPPCTDNILQVVHRKHSGIAGASGVSDEAAVTLL